MGRPDRVPAWICSRSAAPAATRFFATYRAMYAAERSTFVGSLPEQSAAVRRHPSVAVDDDLPTRETGVGLGAISNRPVGLTRMRRRRRRARTRAAPGRSPPADVGASSVSTSTSSRCCALISTVSTRLAVVPSYAIVTWLLPSGRRYGITPPCARRPAAWRGGAPSRSAAASARRSRGRRTEHHPLVPGAERVELVDRSTLAVLERIVDAPCDVGGLFLDRRDHPQVSPSIPKFASVYPISVTVRRTTAGISMYSESRSRRRPSPAPSSPTSRTRRGTRGPPRGWRPGPHRRSGRRACRGAPR